MTNQMFDKAVSFWRILPWLFGAFLALTACRQNKESAIVLKVYPDSVISDVSNHPVGMNLNFLMDGGRFPHPERSVTEAVKAMGVKYLRYPGGEKSDLYLFSRPPWQKAEPALARTAGLGDYPGMFTEDHKFRYDPLDFDEYMEICRATGAEPVVVVAADCYLLDAGEGETLSSREELLQNAVEWVRYANIRKGYSVRYWMIGNESWNSNNANSTVEIYARDVEDFSKAMKAVDPDILIIANGNSDEFFGRVIEVAGDHIDGLCWSNYGVWNFQRGYQTYRDTRQNLIGPTLTALSAVRRHASPEQLNRWKLIVAEYGPIDWADLWPDVNDMGHAIVTFDMAGQLLMQSRVEFSCFWNTRWIGNESDPAADYDALDKDGNFNPTGFSIMIWGNYLASQMVRSESSASILTWASYDPKEEKLFVYLVNKAEQPEVVKIMPDSHSIVSMVQAWEYFGSSPEDTVPIWQQKRIRTNSGVIDLKGFSITVAEMKLTSIDHAK
jgi:alpha-N-arabinofuranosidase